MWRVLARTGQDSPSDKLKARSGLRVDFEDTTGKTASAEYDFFGVSSERSNYKLSLRTYSGRCYNQWLRFESRNARGMEERRHHKSLYSYKHTQILVICDLIA